jgi:hypothetical protein
MRAFFLIFFLASALPSNTFAKTPGEVKIGGHLREATLHRFDGRTNKFSDFKGKPLTINVWPAGAVPVVLRWAHWNGVRAGMTEKTTT